MNPFNKIAVLVLYTMVYSVLLTPAPRALAHHNCDVYTRKIEKIKAKMRQGYSVKQGEKLKKALTRWQDKRVKCERTNHGSLPPKKRKGRK